MAWAECRSAARAKASCKSGCYPVQQHLSAHGSCKLKGQGRAAIEEWLALLYNFNLCWADVMAPSTDCRLTRFLMLEAVPNSSPSIFWARETCEALWPSLRSLIHIL